MAETPDIRGVLNLVAQGQISKDALAEASEAIEKVTQSATRLWLSKRIIAAYISVLAVVTVYLLVLGLWYGKDVTASLFDLLKVGVLPIVIFVLGYYYGVSASKS